MRVSESVMIVCLFGLCTTPRVEAAEKKISQSDLPAAVQKAAQEQSKGATIKGYSQESENGQTLYEVEMIVNGHSKDVNIASDGQVVEIEEQVELTGLPVPLQHGLKAKAGNGEITKVESITKRGRLVAYEAQVKRLGRHSEIQVGPDGNELSHEE
jgi:uncharacterized cupredoxin-like copper-binding protein